MHFCQKRGLHNDPDLHLGGTPIPVVEQFKFLGLIFDRKLSFIPHIKALKAKCLKALDLIKVVANTDWGADRTVLLRLYRSLIRSKLDYGCIVYGSARQSYLRMLDPVHNLGLRLCLGAFRTSPVESLYVEANEPSLHQRRQKLALQYALKLRSNPENPAYSCVFKPNYRALFESKINVIPPFGLRFEPEMEASDLVDAFPSILNYSVPQTAPWLLERPTLLFDLNRHKKSSTDPLAYMNAFLDIRSKYSDFTPIYTDGSKAGVSVSAAAVVPQGGLKSRLPDGSTIFSGELNAILLAFDYIESSDGEKFIIFSDSLSSLQAIDSSDWSNPTVLSVIERYNNLLSIGKKLLFCWIPSHIGIPGNERADLAAKSALDLPVSDIRVCSSDFKYLINKFIHHHWQMSWNLRDSNKLQSIKPKIGPNCPSGVFVRRDEVVLARARIGHTFLTHAFLLKKEPRPECVRCQCPLTVSHILVECVDFTGARQSHFGVTTTLRSLFDTLPDHVIIKYLKDIDMYSRF